MHLPNEKTLLFSKSIFAVVFSVHCIRIPHHFIWIWLDETRNIRLCFGYLNTKYWESLCVCVSGYYRWTLLFGMFFLREHLMLCWETQIGSTWRLQCYTFVTSREEARGTAANKHDISVCINDILCTCLTKRLCFPPKPFLLWFAWSIAYKFHTTLSGYDWMKLEISTCVRDTQSQILRQPLCLCFLDIIEWLYCFECFLSGNISFCAGKH